MTRKETLTANDPGQLEYLAAAGQEEQPHPRVGNALAIGYGRAVRPGHRQMAPDVTAVDPQAAWAFSFRVLAPSRAT